MDGEFITLIQLARELCKALNADKIGKGPRSVVRFPPRQATALMTKYLQKKLGKSFMKFQEMFEEPSELKNEELGISVIRTRVPELKVIGYGDGKVYVVIRYKVNESPRSTCGNSIGILFILSWSC